MFNFFKKSQPKEKASTAEVLVKVRELKRTTWVPKVKEGDGDIYASKFSGIPWIAKSDEWPTCPNCNKPMQLFVQLNLSQLPERPAGCPSEGLVQLF